MRTILALCSAAFIAAMILPTGLHAQRHDDTPTGITAPVDLQDPTPVWTSDLYRMLALRLGDSLRARLPAPKDTSWLGHSVPDVVPAQFSKPTLLAWTVCLEHRRLPTDTTLRRQRATQALVLLRVVLPGNVRRWAVMHLVSQRLVTEPNEAWSIPDGALVAILANYRPGSLAGAWGDTAGCQYAVWAHRPGNREILLLLSCLEGSEYPLRNRMISLQAAASSKGRSALQCIDAHVRVNAWRKELGVTAPRLQFRKNEN